MSRSVGCAAQTALLWPSSGHSSHSTAPKEIDSGFRRLQSTTHLFVRRSDFGRNHTRDPLLKVYGTFWGVRQKGGILCTLAGTANSGSGGAELLRAPCIQLGFARLQKVSEVSVRGELEAQIPAAHPPCSLQHLEVLRPAPQRPAVEDAPAPELPKARQLAGVQDLKERRSNSSSYYRQPAWVSSVLWCYRITRLHA